jgi:hypothetical protein
MVFDNFSEYLRGQRLLLGLDKTVFLFLRIPFVVELPPLACFLVEHLFSSGQVLSFLLLNHNSYKIIDL